MKTILLYPNESKPSVTTISNGNTDVMEVKEAIKKLCNLGLGTYTNDKSGNNKPLMIYSKLTYAQLCADKQIGTTLKDFGVTARDYASHLASLDLNEKKRSHDEVEEESNNDTTNKKPRTRSLTTGLPPRVPKPTSAPPRNNSTHPNTSIQQNNQNQCMTQNQYHPSMFHQPFNNNHQQQLLQQPQTWQQPQIQCIKYNPQHHQPHQLQHQTALTMQYNISHQPPPSQYMQPPPSQHMQPPSSQHMQPPPSQNIYQQSIPPQMQQQPPLPPQMQQQPPPPPQMQQQPPPPPQMQQQPTSEQMQSQQTNSNSTNYYQQISNQAQTQINFQQQIYTQLQPVTSSSKKNQSYVINENIENENEMTIHPLFHASENEEISQNLNLNPSNSNNVFTDSTNHLNSKSNAKLLSTERVINNDRMYGESSGPRPHRRATIVAQENIKQQTQPRQYRKQSSSLSSQPTTEIETETVAEDDIY